jgi:hypothetical protein
MVPSRSFRSRVSSSSLVLRSFATLSRDEMRLAGYPDSTPNIDPCAGIE